MSAWYAFEEQALRLKDEECVWYRANPSEEAVTYTWTQTYQHACRMAQFLLTTGVQPRELVATYLVNSPEFVFTLLGLWAIGSAPALINYNLSGDALLRSVKIPRSKIFLVDEGEACRQRVKDSTPQLENGLGVTIIVLDAALKAKISMLDPIRPSDAYRQGLTPSFPLFLFYTSGTTGFPKACAFPTAAAGVLGDRRLRTTGMKPGPAADTWYDCMPLYHGTGCTMVICSLTTGTRLAIGRRFSVRNFWRDIHDSGANSFIYVGETARYLLAAPPSPLDKTHKLTSMYGNGMRPDIWRKFIERFNIPVVNEFFNSTEGMLSLLNVCRGPFHDGHVGHHGVIQRWRNHHVIVPIQPNHEDGDHILRDPSTGFAVRRSYNEGGEIVIRCATEKAFIGYWDDPKATSNRFLRDVFEKGDLWYRTGDALRRDADGRWFFMDRLGDTYRWKSENVSSQQVAEVLGGFSALDEVNVYGVELPNHDGRAGCAAIYITPNARKSFDFAALTTFSRQRLPKYAIPVFLRLVERQTPMHNNKQTKVPFRREGVDPQKVRQGDAGKNDALLWLSPGANSYVHFLDSDWDAISNGKISL